MSRRQSNSQRATADKYSGLIFHFPFSSRYERTGWFLEWVEDHSKKGREWLKRVNIRLAKEEWGDWVWHEAGAEGVEELWKGYIRSFDPSDETMPPGDGPPPALPTHSV